MKQLVILVSVSGDLSPKSFMLKRARPNEQRHRETRVQFQFNSAADELQPDSQLSDMCNAQ